MNGGGAATIINGACINGDPNVPGDLFGQFAACGATQFWQDVNVATAAGLITNLPNSLDIFGRPCLTTRSFEIVDADPSDNMVTIYLWDKATNTVMQASAANKALFPNAVELTNGSDNRLLDVSVGPAIGCPTLKAPNMASQVVDPVYGMMGSLGLNEIRAAALAILSPNMPQALVPVNDPMTIPMAADGTKKPQKAGPNVAMMIAKTNAFRVAVNQVPLIAGTDPAAQAASYCQNFLTITATSILQDQRVTAVQVSPDIAAGTNLFTFLVNRHAQSWVTLNCDAVLKQQNMKVNYIDKANKMPLVPILNGEMVCTGVKPNTMALKNTVALLPLTTAAIALPPIMLGNKAAGILGGVAMTAVASGGALMPPGISSVLQPVVTNVPFSAVATAVAPGALLTPGFSTILQPSVTRTPFGAVTPAMALSTGLAVVPGFTAAFQPSVFAPLSIPIPAAAAATAAPVPQAIQAPPVLPQTTTAALNNAIPGMMQVGTSCTQNGLYQCGAPMNALGQSSINICSGNMWVQVRREVMSNF